MRIYTLETNDGSTHVRQCPTREQMYAYIREQRAKGRSLSEIKFVYGAVEVEDMRTVMARLVSTAGK